MFSIILFCLYIDYMFIEVSNIIRIFIFTIIFILVNSKYNFKFKKIIKFIVDLSLYFSYAIILIFIIDSVLGTDFISTIY